MRNKLKRFFRRKLRNLRHKLNPHLYEPTFWIGLAVNHKVGQIVQIGSNDGKADDPLHELIKKNPQWEAHFIEPVAYIFERLKANYGQDNRFHFHQIAINDGSTQVFYAVAPRAAVELTDLPKYYNKLGSFYRNNIVKHLGERIEPYIEETIIEGRALDQFFTTNAIETILVLHIDTEGYDWEILKQLDLKKYAPTVVLFEHKHLSIADKNLALKHFQLGYETYRFNQDILCLQKSLLATFSQKEQRTLNTKRIFSF